MLSLEFLFKQRRLVMGRSLLVCVVVVCVGCANKEFWQNDMPVKAVTMESNAYAAEAWQTQVEWDISRWRDVLPEGCDMPFHFDQDNPDARTVTLVPSSDWPDGGYIGTFSGRKSTIIILEFNMLTQDDFKHNFYWNELLHELGHSFGLGHSDPAYGPSLMLPRGGKMEPRDIEAAACYLGCGPCGPDPFDKP